MVNLDNLSLYTDKGNFIFINDETGETYPTLQTASNLLGITEDTLQKFVELSSKQEEIYKAKVTLAKPYYLRVITTEQFLMCCHRYGIDSNLSALIGLEGINTYLKYIVDYLPYPEGEKLRRFTRRLETVRTPHF